MRIRNFTFWGRRYLYDNQQDIFAVIVIMVVNDELSRMLDESSFEVFGNLSFPRNGNMQLIFKIEHFYLFARAGEAIDSQASGLKPTSLAVCLFRKYRENLTTSHKPAYPPRRWRA